MNAFPRQTDATAGFSLTAMNASATSLDSGDDREILFALFAPCLGYMAAAEATEALLARFDTLADIVKAAPCDLLSVPELGEAGAAALVAVQMAAAELERLRTACRPVLLHAGAWVAHLRRGSAGIATGEFRALFLSAAGVLLSEETVGLNGTAPLPGKIIRRALALEAEGIVLARGEADGEPVASESDIVSGCMLHRAARLMGMRLHDHLVIGRSDHASLRDAAVLPD